MKAVGRVITENGVSDSFSFEKEVGQGCSLSPMLFIVVGVKITILVEADIGDAGCRIEGHTI